jgi:hypothetical protein
MMTNYCAKEKKDIPSLAKLKELAVFQQLGKEELLNSDNQELLPRFWAGYKEVVKKLGGQEKWRSISSDKQKAHLAKMSEDVIIKLGKDVYDIMTPPEKRCLTYFVWAGCGCHKDLNTVRGGYAAMAAWWINQKSDVTPPILLANKDNAAVIADITPNQDGVTPAQERAFESTTRGAIKALQLAGAIFNHKDDKKGHHNVFRHWWRVNMGVELTFPDVSNTRFGTYCEAAGFIFLYKTKILEYLIYAKTRKDKGTFNHMEQNFWNALNDTPTFTECAVLALYGQAISQPYMQFIRTPGQNMLNLGPYHKRVTSHVYAIAKNPYLLIGPDASYSTGALDCREWNSPAIFSAIHSAASTLPHFSSLTVGSKTFPMFGHFLKFS